QPEASSPGAKDENTGAGLCRSRLVVQERLGHYTFSFIRTLAQGEPLVFNQVVNPGGGESTDCKRLMATIFSVYNLSRQQSAYKRTMDEDDFIELSAALEIAYDNTIIVLFKRGKIKDASDGNKNSNITESRISNQSTFR
ncbi:hypothetical protein ACSZOL_21660, partial [Aeromonas hydrophila]